MLIGATGALVAAVMFVYGLARVMRRRDAHLARDHVLREGLIDYGRWLAGRHGDTRADEHVEAMTRIHDDARIDEIDRPAAVHLVLILLFPLWYLYVLYYLTRDLPDHARRQARFLRETHNVLDEAGLDVPEVEAVPTVSERSYLLTLLLVLIVPFGNLLVLYWLYNDAEEHFDQQWGHEDALVDVLSEQGTAAGSLGEAAEETAPDAPDGVDPGPPQAQEGQPAEPEAELQAEEDQAPEGEPEFTVWSCPECESRYKVPPKRPVRVTCKECEHQEILEE